jgi:hypothetical protein
MPDPPLLPPSVAASAAAIPADDPGALLMLAAMAALTLGALVLSVSLLAAGALRRPTRAPPPAPDRSRQRLPVRLLEQACFVAVAVVVVAFMVVVAAGPLPVRVADAVLPLLLPVTALWWAWRRGVWSQPGGTP